MSDVIDAIVANNDALSKDEITEAIQSTLPRGVTVRVIEDTSIEEPIQKTTSIEKPNQETMQRNEIAELEQRAEDLQRDLEHLDAERLDVEKALLTLAERYKTCGRLLRANVATHAISIATDFAARRATELLASVWCEDDSKDEAMYVDWLSEAHDAALTPLIARWSFEHANAPFRVLSYEALLWPRRLQELETRVISEPLQKWLRERASAYLTDGNDNIPKPILEHWKALADGKLPPRFRPYVDRLVPQHEFSLRALLDPSQTPLVLGVTAEAWLRAEAARESPQSEHARRIATTDWLPYGFVSSQ